MRNNGEKTTYAIILAGGIGKRVGGDIPKQFIKVYEKPVLLYTLESFQRHHGIDEIIVACVKEWVDNVALYPQQYGIAKLTQIVEGGETVQESIKNGVDCLRRRASENDIVVIHDGIRPLIEPAVLTDVLRVTQIHGNAVTSLPYNEQIFIVNPEDEETTREYIPRDTLRRVATPQAYRYGLLDRAYKEAFEKKIGLQGASYTNTMMVELGETLYFAAGSEKNLKITTKDDLELFKGYLNATGRGSNESA